MNDSSHRPETDRTASIPLDLLDYEILVSDMDSSAGITEQLESFNSQRLKIDS